jgi:hypothetical protein
LAPRAKPRRGNLPSRMAASHASLWIAHHDEDCQVFG